MGVPPFLAHIEPPFSTPSDARLRALYAFNRTQRESNPDGYAFNVRWWSDAIAATLPTGWAGAQSDTGRDVLVLRVDNALAERLANDAGARPKGLGGVIESMTASSTLIPLGRYMESTMPIEASPGIASRVVGGLVNAGWSALGRLSPFGGGEPTEEQVWKSLSGKDYVHVPSVKAAARKFAEYISNTPPLDYTDTLYSRTAFAKAFASEAAPGKSAMSKRDVDVLVRWLERDAGSIYVDGDVIKIITGDAHPITEADRGAVSVTDALERVDGQIDAAEAEAAQCELKARNHLKAGKRTLAASYLRSKKQLDDLVAKRVAAGEQLRSVKRALNQAKGDAEIMSAYESSTAALSVALSDPRLSPERISATTDALADALADQQEIDDAIKIAGQATAPVIDDDELEKELAAMVLEEKAEQEKREKERVQREKEEKERKEKEERERREKEEREKKETAERAERERLRKEKAAAEKPQQAARDSQADWETRHADAQAREAAERARAEAERLAKEEQRVPAE